MKQKQKPFDSPLESGHMRVRSKVITLNYKVKEKSQKGQDVKEDQPTIQMTSELISEFKR